MKTVPIAQSTWRWVPAVGLLSVGGCAATLERSLDFVLAGEALENLLHWPSSSLVQFAQFVVRVAF